MKQFLILPVAIAILTACSSTTPAPVEYASGNLPSGVMEPVSIAETNNGTWQPKVIQQPMPTNMDIAPSYQQKVNVAKQNTNSQVVPVTRNVSQNFTIPRNPTTNAPEYSKIDKGFYKGSSYNVRKGDTMFLIAYISGITVDELAAANNMSEPYNLAIGQTLTIPGNTSEVVANTTVASPKVTEPAKPQVTYRDGPNGTKYGSDGTIIGPIKSTVGTPQQAKTASTPMVTTQTPTRSITPTPVNTRKQVASNITWQWPTNGKITQGFSSADGGNKGIDISGSRGQAINAASSGRVVYAGDALRGYGNLIIIKHNNDYLSAYAHNEEILVKDQQEVRAGQQIAKMGSSGTNSVKLHFEIRYKGKSVDPIGYLPRH